MKRFIVVLLSASLLLCSCARDNAPLIGISTGFSSGKATVGESYVQSVINAGGIPYIIPLMRDSAMTEKIVSRLDGIVFTGGEDFDPAYYGEEPAEMLGDVNGPRDTSDFLLMRSAMRQKIAILGICRGEQGLNIALGGSLYQDLPSQHPAAHDSTLLLHRQSESHRVATMTVAIAPGSHLSKIIGADTLRVNSHHHQAVKDPAPGITVTAVASDGVVEAFEDMSRNMVAVQFHPESFAQDGIDPYLAIFEDLVSRAKGR